MSGQRSSSAGLGRGVVLAGALSVVFIGIAAVASPLLGALVVLPAGLLGGALRARAVPQSTPHTLVAPRFGSISVIRAPRSADAINARGAAPAA